jgi:GTP-binding protein
MFIDEAELRVLGGAGGAGLVHLRREKFAPRGGPDGGDGGDGGSVILVADPSLSSLLDYRYATDYKAEPGGPGGPNDRSGKRGRDLYLKVPVGTQVFAQPTGDLLCDLSEPGLGVEVAKGGRGGRGNARFATPVARTPRHAEKGEPGEERSIRLELKLLADLGIIGLPNAGKSTLLSRISKARPKVADYPFTTLIPNLGVVRVGDSTMVAADIPGLIEGAHKGAGLGDRFLKHIERTRVLVHLIDTASVTGHGELESAYLTVREELKGFGCGLPELPELVGLNKVDAVSDFGVLEAFERLLADRGVSTFRISGATGQGVGTLVGAAWAIVSETRAADGARPPKAADIRVLRLPREKSWTALLDADGVFCVSGKLPELMVAQADLDNEESVRHLHNRLRRAGVLKKLKRLGVKEGDTVRVGDIEFEYVE